jgi:TPR repeat protein
VPKDDAEATRWWRASAKQGFAHAEYNLGVRYAKGLTVPQDFATARELWLKAARQGDRDAQANLGVMYFRGDGVARDNVRAYAWLSLALPKFSEKDHREKIAGNPDLAARSMTAEQVAAAHRLAADWGVK